MRMVIEIKGYPGRDSLRIDEKSRRCKKSAGLLKEVGVGVCGTHERDFKETTPQVGGSNYPPALNKKIRCPNCSTQRLVLIPPTLRAV